MYCYRTLNTYSPFTAIDQVKSTYSTHLYDAKYLFTGMPRKRPKTSIELFPSHHNIPNSYQKLGCNFICILWGVYFIRLQGRYVMSIEPQQADDDAI